MGIFILAKEIENNSQLVYVSKEIINCKKQYLVKVQTQSSEQKQAVSQLEFEEINLNSYDFFHKHLILYIDNENNSNILIKEFVGFKGDILEVDNFKSSIIKKDDSLVLMFEITNLPKKIVFDSPNYYMYYTIKNKGILNVPALKAKKR